jgi:integrase
MPKKAKELSAIEVNRLTTQGAYAVGGVAGLMLQVSKTGARSWILRARIGNKRRDIGLGGYPEITLAIARKRALEKKDLITAGIDPIEEKKAARQRLIAAQLKAITFDWAAEQVHKKKSEELTNDKYIAQWISVVNRYASPIIGNLHPSDVTLDHIKQILDPIWLTKTDTAKKLRGNLEDIFAWCAVHEYRSAHNPARWQGYLDAIYQKPSKVSKVQHYKSMPIDDMPAFMKALSKQEGISARGLEFTILTAARSGEVRGANWSEIDFDAKVWTIPADRMKARKEHQVSLSNQAIKLLKNAVRFEGNDLLFPSPRGGMLSDMSLAAVLKRMKLDYVPHGFRATFKTWASERTDYPRDVIEKALAHTIGSKVEQAYERGFLLPKRALMMQEWADFITTATHADHE